MSVEPGQIPENTQNIIAQLKEEPNFLAVRYNQQRKKKQTKGGGAYVPPHKLREMQQKLLQQAPGSKNHQNMMWQLLRKSINGIVNKVNITNIQNVVIELFNENILRGMGLLTRAIIKAQMASPNFTHVYAALVAVINTKLPQIGNLLIARVMIMFHRSFQRNNKIVCMATTKMIAHLINQRVLGEFAGLQLLMILLMHATQDSVQIACDFMIEAGQILSEVSPAAANAIFQRFKNLLHEAQIGEKAQYSIQKLFAIRKTGFKDHPGVIPQLDLVQAEDQITHNMDFQQQLKGQQNLNMFRVDPNYEQNQQEWEKIKLQILGQENIINLKQVAHYQQQVQQYNQQQQPQGIQDLTEQDLINLRRTIYLAIQSTVNFQQCAHKILKMNITKGYESQLIDMILECCMMERIYQQFFGLLSQRFCKIDDLYKQLFIQSFVNYYNTIFKLQVNKIRNLAKLYGHLFHTFSIDWKIMQVITLKPDTTTSAHRMFLKIMFRQIAQNLGIQKLSKEFNIPEMRQFYSGLFPIGHPNDVRFAINYWTSIGLGKLTQEMREVLELQEQMIADRKNRQQQQRIQQLLKEEQEMLMAEEMERRQMEQRLREEEQKQKIKRQAIVKRQKQQRERERQQKKYQRQKQQREREKERQRQKRQLQRQRNKQRQRQRQRERERERSNQKYRQRHKDYQRQKERQKQRQKQRQIQKNRQKQKNKKAANSQSSSQSSSSSSSSDSQETPKVNKLKQQRHYVSRKGIVKVSQKKRIESSQSQNESQSSGIQSQQSSSNKKSQDSKNVKKVETDQKKKQTQLNKRVSSNSSSQQSSSSQSKSQQVRRKQSPIQKQRSRKKPDTRRRRESSSSSESERKNKKRGRSRSNQYRRRR